jgi:hypothetical protein
MARANVAVHRIADAARLYRLVHHHWPTWDELAAEPIDNGYPGDLRDPWDHPYELELGDTADVLVVLCSGPDGDAGTEDDFVVTVR